MGLVGLQVLALGLLLASCSTLAGNNISRETVTASMLLGRLNGNDDFDSRLFLSDDFRYQYQGQLIAPFDADQLLEHIQRTSYINVADFAYTAHFRNDLVFTDDNHASISQSSTAMMASPSLVCRTIITEPWIEPEGWDWSTDSPPDARIDLSSSVSGIADRYLLTVIPGQEHFLLGNLDIQISIDRQNLESALARVGNPQPEYYDASITVIPGWEEISMRPRIPVHWSLSYEVDGVTHSAEATTEYALAYPWHNWR